MAWRAGSKQLDSRKTDSEAIVNVNVKVEMNYRMGDRALIAMLWMVPLSKRPADVI